MKKKFWPQSKENFWFVGILTQERKTMDLQKSFVWKDLATYLIKRTKLTAQN